MIQGGVGASFCRLWATLGGSGRVLEASTRGVFDRVAPRECQRTISTDFGSILYGILKVFGELFACVSKDFVKIFRETVNDKLKPGTDSTQDVN